MVIPYWWYLYKEMAPITFLSATSPQCLCKHIQQLLQFYFNTYHKYLKMKKQKKKRVNKSNRKESIHIPQDGKPLKAEVEWKTDW